jgi:predicted HTH transcriptional regulator
MGWPAVLHRIQQGEDERTEFKRWSHSLERVGEAICAFANSTGGLLVLGVGNRGEIEGVAGEPDQVQEKLSDFLKTGLSAPVMVRLGRHTLPEGVVHWLEVQRMRGPVPLSYRGRVFVRRGRGNDQPSDTEFHNAQVFAGREDLRVVESHES